MEDTTMAVLIMFILCACIVICIYINHVIPQDTPEIQHETCTTVTAEGHSRGHTFKNTTIICPPLNQ